MSVLVGVAGGTGSGKTSFAQKVLDRIGPEHCLLVAQDSYYKDGSAPRARRPGRDQLRPPGRFRHLAARAGPARLEGGPPRPLSHLRPRLLRPQGAPRPPDPAPRRHLEGILLLVEEPLRRLLDIKLFIDADADVRILRRLQRDLKERGRSFESVKRQYLASVRPMHLEFVEPSKRYADLIIPEGAENEVALEAVVARIQRMLRAEGEAERRERRASG